MADETMQGSATTEPAPKAEPKAKTKAEPKAKTVRMVRDAEQYPVPPHSAEVHVDEVDNWAKHGWTRAAD